MYINLGPRNVIKLTLQSFNNFNKNNQLMDLDGNHPRTGSFRWLSSHTHCPNCAWRSEKATHSRHQYAQVVGMWGAQRFCVGQMAKILKNANYVHMSIPYIYIYPHTVRSVGMNEHKYIIIWYKLRFINHKIYETFCIWKKIRRERERAWSWVSKLAVISLLCRW